MQHALRVQERQHGDVCIAVLSEVHLDHAASLSNLRALFQGYHDADFVPLAIVLCGNFCGTRGADDAAHLARYEEGFAALAEILARFPRLLDETHLVLVPGPDDPVATPVLPRARIPAPLVARFERRLPRAFCAERVHWASNPCRLVYFSQEIVVFRDDVMSKMLRSALPLSTDVQASDLPKLVRAAAHAARLDAARPGASVSPAAARAPRAVGVCACAAAVPDAQCGAYA